MIISSVSSSISEGGGHIQYSYQLQINCAEHEYMNNYVSLSLIKLTTDYNIGLTFAADRTGEKHLYTNNME